MEKLVLTIKDNSKLHFLLELIKQLDFVEVQKPTSDRKKSTKRYNFFASAGLWKNRNINSQELRKEAWKRTS